MRHLCKLLLVAPCAPPWRAATWAKEDAPSPIGKKVDEFSLQDFRGKAHSLADLKDAKLVVVAFLGVECPLSKLYGPRLAELAASTSPRAWPLSASIRIARIRSPRWRNSPRCTTSSFRS